MTRYLAVILVLVLLVAGGLAWQRAPRDSGLPQLGLGGDFTLVEAGSGQPFRLDSQRGRVVLLSFGYTHCPDVCPMTLARYRAVLAALADVDREAANRLQPVLVTVDPARDTPEILASYVRYFSPRILGLTGSADQLADVERRFGAIVELPAAGGDGRVSHSDYLYLIDTQGRTRRLYAQDAAVSDIVREVRALLRESVAS